MSDQWVISATWYKYRELLLFSPQYQSRGIDNEPQRPVFFAVLYILYMLTMITIIIVKGELTLWGSYLQIGLIFTPKKENRKR